MHASQPVSLLWFALPLTISPANPPSLPQRCSNWRQTALPPARCSRPTLVPSMPPAPPLPCYPGWASRLAAAPAAAACACCPRPGCSSSSCSSALTAAAACPAAAMAWRCRFHWAASRHPSARRQVPLADCQTRCTPTPQLAQLLAAVLPHLAAQDLAATPHLVLHGWQVPAAAAAALTSAPGRSRLAAAAGLVPGRPWRVLAAAARMHRPALWWPPAASCAALHPPL